MLGQTTTWVLNGHVDPTVKPGPGRITFGVSEIAVDDSGGGFTPIGQALRPGDLIHIHQVGESNRVTRFVVSGTTPAERDGWWRLAGTWKISGGFDPGARIVFYAQPSAGLGP